MVWIPVHDKVKQGKTNKGDQGRPNPGRNSFGSFRASDQKEVIALAPIGIDGHRDLVSYHIAVLKAYHGNGRAVSHFKGDSFHTFFACGRLGYDPELVLAIRDLGGVEDKLDRRAEFSKRLRILIQKHPDFTIVIHSWG